MTIHKRWSQHLKFEIKNHYSKQKEALNKFMSSFVLSKDVIDLKKITQEYSKITPTPPAKEISHLNDLAVEFNKESIMELRTMVRRIKRRSGQLFREMENIRGSFYCQLCNWRNHQAISPETMTVNIHKKFRERFMRKYKQFLMETFSKIYKHALILDEFVELISNYKLIKYNADKGILHKYKILVEKCMGEPKMCDQVMGEFNLNKYSYMFDG